MLGAKLRNETIERARQLTVEQMGDLLHARPHWGYGETKRRGQRCVLGSGLGQYRPLVGADLWKEIGSPVVCEPSLDGNRQIVVLSVVRDEAR
jgi:hypothetical protein